MSRHKIDAIKKYFLVCSLVLLGSNQIFKAYEARCLSLKSFGSNLASIVFYSNIALPRAVCIFLLKNIMFGHQSRSGDIVIIVPRLDDKCLLFAL